MAGLDKIESKETTPKAKAKAKEPVVEETPAVEEELPRERLNPASTKVVVSGGGRRVTYADKAELEKTVKGNK